MTNQDFSRQFRLYAELLLLHGRDERTADYLAGAAYRLRQLESPVADLSPKELASLFRPLIAKLIREGSENGSLTELDELIELTPQGLFELMRIKGLGGKKLHALWKEAKIDNIEDLLKAAQAGEISRLPGFGKKTEQNIIAAIRQANSQATSFHYADVADIGEALTGALKTILKTDFVSLCGEIRRQTTTVTAMDLIAAIPAKSLRTASTRKLLVIQSTEGATTTGHTLDDIPVNIHHTTESDFYKQLFELTGSPGHVAKIKKAAKTLAKPFPSEEAIYKSAKLPYIVPEMREDLAEWEYVKDPKPLITSADIKGVVHNHTTWSDGVDTLEDFVKACKKKGYEYAIISDHSQNAHYAGGLKPDKVHRQLEAIDKLNEKLKPFKVFKSIECDIRVSGELDYDTALLKEFDLVIISIHQQLKMTEEKASARLIRAIENPFTTILGHMTGRQLLVRPGYPLDFKKVIDACAANNVIIEVNANPYRLDMDWSHLPYALEKGVMISIDPDAHSIGEIDNIRWGVCAARKGGLTRDMTWNAQSLPAISRWLKQRRQHSTQHA